MKVFCPIYTARRFCTKSISLLLAIIFLSCHSDDPGVSAQMEVEYDKALKNAVAAHEGFVRCANYMNDWLSMADPLSKLVPRRIVDGPDGDIWNAKDCAADNFPFLVLTSFFTDQKKYNGRMLEMLENEKRLTSRVKSLPDTYSFSKMGFDDEEISMNRIIFGTAEYMKDGLMPITEWLGQSPWLDRMLTMLDDLNIYVDVAGEFDDSFGPAGQVEINGDLLQVLSRIYWMTGERKYLDWAVQIGDYYLLRDGYPLNHLDYLRLRDHGCELVAGLCELYVSLNYTNPRKKLQYRDSLYKLLYFILDNGRNEDGFFYNAINPQTGEVVDENISDSWGYMLNAYYSIYMVDQEERYRDPLLKIFGNLHKYHNFNWESLGADGYADAIEGALNLYNRVPDDRAAAWIDREIQVMWSIQDSSFRDNAQQWKGRGIIEGWYGDGNFARTTLMYNLWKSQGVSIQPWSEGVFMGAERHNDTLYLALHADLNWQGKLNFDKARHSQVMKMPIDWARINQFPEWFTIQPYTKYHIINPEGEVLYDVEGQTLHKGLDVTLEPGKPLYLRVYATVETNPTQGY